MNVMFEIERMKYHHIGLYYFSLNLGNALANCKPNHHQIGYYGTQPALSLFDVPNNQKLRQSSLHKCYLPIPKHIDVWHCGYHMSAYFPFKKSVKVVMTVHDLNFMYDVNRTKRRKASYLDGVARYIKRADHVVTISKFVQDDLKRFGILPQDKPSSVIYNGCSVSATKETMRTPSFVPKRPFLFSISVIARKKNFHVLPAVLKHLDVDLVIAGKFENPTYLREIRAEIARYDLQERVHLLGTISDNDKHWYLQNCQAFVFLSLSEGFGIPVIEAMNFGKPVILSRLTSLPEIGGKMAYYVDDFSPSHIAKTVSHAINEVQVKGLASSIKAYAQKFDWDTAAKAYWKIYESLY